MRWVEHINDELPAPRDDEPESLRQNIADELADHLHCALNHELHRTGDETEAKQNVLNRFGNVQQIARKLWFAAMQEKIMSQRITLIMSTITAVACLAAVALVWNVVSENRAVNLAILEQLKSQSKIVAELKSTEWSPIKIKLVPEEQGGKPAEGFHIQLHGNIFGKQGSASSGLADKRTNKEGVADFGLFRPGSYKILITSPSKETMVKQFAVLPGSSGPLEILCPASARKKMDVQISVDWPEDIQKNGLWLVCDYCQRSYRIGNENWYSNNDESQFVVSPEGTLYEFDSDFYTQLRVDPEKSVTMNGKPLEAKDFLQLPEGEFALLLMTFTTPEPIDSAVESDIRYLDILSSYDFESPFWKTKNPAFGFGGGGFFSISSFAAGEPGDPLPAPTFVVKPGNKNHWKLTLPKELIAAARKQLEADKK